jgi:membrane protease YdiL (CAAX protease family)
MWSSLPVAVRAVIAGFVAATFGGLPWAILISANTKHWPAVPWAVLPAAAYLWLYWKYVRGWGWPASNSESRRTMCRANRVPREVWPTAIVAGIIGLTAVVLLQSITSRLVTLPQQRDLDPSQFPAVTVIIWVIMSAIVAGVAEETSFRGYMQEPIERRHGPIAAILITGTVFGFAHFGHPEVGLILLPYYILVAAVYGLLAYLTKSIYPSLVLHAAGNMLGALDLVTRGRSEWGASAKPAPLVGETGPDATFWMLIAGFLIALSASVAAFAALRRATQRAQNSPKSG